MREGLVETVLQLLRELSPTPVGRREETTLSVVLCSSLDEEILSSSDTIFTVSYPLWQLLFISQELLISLKHYKARDCFQGGSVICWSAQWKFAEEVQGAGLFRCPVQT